MEGKRIPNAALHGHVEGKRGRGRQRKTWMDNVREDLKERNIDLTRIGEATRNREVWRNLVRASLSARLWKREKKKKIYQQLQGLTMGGASSVQAANIIMFKFFQKFHTDIASINPNLNIWHH